jgi:hypothetical protein
MLYGCVSLFLLEDFQQCQTEMRQSQARYLEQWGKKADTVKKALQIGRKINNLEGEFLGAGMLALSSKERLNNALEEELRVALNGFQHNAVLSEICSLLILSNEIKDGFWSWLLRSNMVMSAKFKCQQATLFVSHGLKPNGLEDHPNAVLSTSSVEASNRPEVTPIIATVGAFRGLISNSVSHESPYVLREEAPWNSSGSMVESGTHAINLQAQRTVLGPQGANEGRREIATIAANGATNVNFHKACDTHDVHADATFLYHYDTHDVHAGGTFIYDTHDVLTDATFIYDTHDVLTDSGFVLSDQYQTFGMTSDPHNLQTGSLDEALPLMLNTYNVLADASSVPTFCPT